MAGYVYPNCVSVVLYEGGRVRLHPDQKWPADDPFVRARPEFFNAQPQRVAHSDSYTEAATAAPGEKRVVRRGRPPKAKAEDLGE